MMVKDENVSSLVFEIHNQSKVQFLKIYSDKLVFTPNKTFVHLLIGKKRNSLIFEYPYERVTDISVENDEETQTLTVSARLENGEIQKHSIICDEINSKRVNEIIKYVKSKIK